MVSYFVFFDLFPRNTVDDKELIDLVALIIIVIFDNDNDNENKMLQ